MRHRRRCVLSIARVVAVSVYLFVFSLFISRDKIPPTCAQRNRGSTPLTATVHSMELLAIKEKVDRLMKAAALHRRQASQSERDNFKLKSQVTHIKSKYKTAERRYARTRNLTERYKKQRDAVEKENVAARKTAMEDAVKIADLNRQLLALKNKPVATSDASSLLHAMGDMEKQEANLAVSQQRAPLYPRCFVCIACGGGGGCLSLHLSPSAPQNSRRRAS